MKRWYSLMAMAALMLFVVAGPCLAGTDKPRVLFDQGHGQQFVIERSGDLDLSALAEVLRTQGLEVFSGTLPLAAETLAGIDALVLSGPFAPLQSQEVEALVKFVEGGGRLCVMLHIGQPAADLLHRLGVDFSNGVIREAEEVLGGEPLNYRVTRFTAHPVTEGLETMEVYGGWAVASFEEGASTIAATGPRAWVDLDQDGKQGSADAVQSFGVAVAGRRGSGAFVVFGDDAIFQNRFLGEANRKLARNLALWLGARR